MGEKDTHIKDTYFWVIIWFILINLGYKIIEHKEVYDTSYRYNNCVHLDNATQPDICIDIRQQFVFFYPTCRLDEATGWKMCELWLYPPRPYLLGQRFLSNWVQAIGNFKNLFYYFKLAISICVHNFCTYPVYASMPCTKIHRKTIIKTEWFILNTRGNAYVACSTETFFA